MRTVRTKHREAIKMVDSMQGCQEDSRIQRREVSKREKSPC